MTRARNFADVISGQFDLPAAALDNALSDVVSDTTPQLGGNLDAQTNNITNVGSVGIGTNSPTGDLEVESSSATNGLVRMGQLQFKNSSGNHTQNTDGVHIFPFSDGNMYHDNYDGGYVWRTGAAVERLSLIHI